MVLLYLWYAVHHEDSYEMDCCVLLLLDLRHMIHDRGAVRLPV